MPPDPATKAFIAAASHVFAGINLQPYTPARIVAAQAIGLKYPNIAEDALESFNKTGIYPGALQDVLIVLWLCTLTEDKQVTRALRSPDESLGKAITWGATHGITDTKSEAWWAAYDVFINIMVQINASRSDPQLPTSDSPQDDDDPNE
jgi:hypothetical protein